jgi:hypothetical protein
MSRIISCFHTRPSALRPCHTTPSPRARSFCATNAHLLLNTHFYLQHLLLSHIDNIKKNLNFRDRYFAYSTPHGLQARNEAITSVT